MAHPNISVRNIGGLDIPQHDYIDIAYFGSTNNISTVTYKEGGASGQTVATLTLTYVGGTPGADDARLDTVTRS
jgi:hypothetical protein